MPGGKLEASSDSPRQSEAGGDEERTFLYHVTPRQPLRRTASQNGGSGSFRTCASISQGSGGSHRGGRRREVRFSEEVVEHSTAGATPRPHGFAMSGRRLTRKAAKDEKEAAAAAVAAAAAAEEEEEERSVGFQPEWLPEKEARTEQQQQQLPREELLPGSSKGKKSALAFPRLARSLTPARGQSPSSQSRLLVTPTLVLFGYCY